MNSTLKQLEDTLDLYFVKKAPALPVNIKELLVKIVPFLIIISLVLTIPAILALLGLGSLATMMAPVGGQAAMLPNMWLGIVLLIPVAVLEAMAVPGLLGRKAVGWKYAFWAQLVAVVANVVQLNIVGAVIGALIGFYILFQIKSYYK